MITSLRLVDFKNFADETLHLGPFTVIVGANASGKSNIRDAFRFLHGIGRGYTVTEVLGGKYGAGGQAEWMSIRGAPKEINRLKAAGPSPGFTIAVTFALPIGRTETHFFEVGTAYTIEVSGGDEHSAGFRVHREELTVGNERIYTSHPGDGDPVHRQDNDTHLLIRMAKTGTQRKYGARIAVRRDQPALTQIREHKPVARSHKDYANRVIDVLTNMRFLDLIPDRMRQPAFPGQTVLGDSGENLSTVLRKICADPERKTNLIDWVRELTPMDVTDFDFPVDPVTGLVHLVIRETERRKLSAYSVSDGTLRFLAMLAALLAENKTGLYFLEEIDNGIHPVRLGLLLDLFEGPARGHTQVVGTTHAPTLLTVMNENTFRHTSVTCRLEETANAIIRPIAELQNVQELRQSQGLGRLHESGWMETALAFTEGSREDDRS